MAVVLGVWAWIVVKLTTASLWLDEAWSLWAVEPSTAGGALARVIGDVHPPLYFLLLHPWTRFAGDSELAARLPSALAAALSVALLYRLGRAWFSARAGVLAALTLGASSFYVYYAREARMYMLAALLATVSMYTYAQWWARGGAWRRWRYIGVTAALLYTHYFGALIPLAQAVHYALARRAAARPPGRFGFLLVGVGAVFAPWLPFLWLQARTRPGGLAQALPTDAAALKALATLLSSGQWALFGGLIAIALATALGISFSSGLLSRISGNAPPRFRQHLSVPFPLWDATLTAEGKPWLWLAALWALLPLALTLAINPVFPIYTPRNILVVMPGFALLVGVGLARLRAPLAAALAALIVLTGPNARHALLPDKLPWRDFVRDMAAHYQPGEPVLIHQGEHLFTLPFRYYFRHRWPGAPEPISVYALPMPPPGAAFEQAVRAATHDHTRVWLVTGWPTQILSFTAFYLKETRHGESMVAAYEVGGYRFAPPPDPDETLTFGPNLHMRHQLDRFRYAPGETVDLALHWVVLGPPEAPYRAAVHLVDRADHVVAAHDGPFPVEEPLTTGAAFDDPRPLTLPPDLESGVYTIQVFLYTESDTPAVEARDEAGMRVGWIPVLRALEVVSP